jgi:hypothetical protein
LAPALIWWLAQPLFQESRSLAASRLQSVAESQACRRAAGCKSALQSARTQALRLALLPAPAIAISILAKTIVSPA